MTITVETQPAPADALIIPFLQTDALPDQLNLLGAQIGLPPAVLQADFGATPSDVLPLYGPDGQRIYLLGLGEQPLAMDWLRQFRKLFFGLKDKLPARVVVDLTGLSDEVIEAVVLGIRGGGYDLGLYQTDKGAPPVFYTNDGQLQLVVADAEREGARRALLRAEILADAQRAMLNLMNAPASHKSPQTLANWALRSGQTHGYRVSVLNKVQLERQGMGALLSVSQGSDHPPVLIVMDYQPPGLPEGPIVGLVGKGVTFDTGGVSIKSSANMHLMKSDMGGAAAVFGTLEAAARLRLPVRVVGVVPATENNIDGRSTKPGDVVTTYLGKTIEVIDTDAEGRVILADGLGYLIRQFRPDILIDLATLTGNVIAALGYQAAGLFTANDDLARHLSEAGDRTGERLWRLPLWDAYREDLRSDVADLKNFSGKPVAGAILAAKFLEVFTESHPAWAHLDIAGMAFADNEFGHQKNATGFGIRLLIDYLRNLSGQ